MHTHTHTYEEYIKYGACTLRCGRLYVRQKSLYPESTVWYVAKVLSCQIFVGKNFFTWICTIFSHRIPIVFHKKAHHSRRLSNLFIFLPTLYTHVRSFYRYTYIFLCSCCTMYDILYIVYWKEEKNGREWRKTASLVSITLFITYFIIFLLDN